MFGLRTPTKPHSATTVEANKQDKLSVQTSVVAAGVRKSIDQWEGVTNEEKKVRTYTNAKTYRSKAAEATAVQQSALLQLDAARTLKGEIKIAVTTAIKRLCELVKEAEAQTREGNEKKNDKGNEEETGKDNDKIDNTRQVKSNGMEEQLIRLGKETKKLEEITKLLQENISEQNGKEKRLEEKIEIYSDSRSALDAIVSGRSLDPQVAEIRRSLEECRKRGTHISLFWVKAHVGTPGNERADTLAKEAAERLRSKPEYAAYPLSYVKHQIRQKTLDVWNERYLGGETAGTTKLFIANVRTAYKLIKEKRFTPQMAQILTGHGAFAHYLHRFKIRTSPACDCGDEEQTVEHVLLHCPIFASSRHDLEQQMQMTVDRNGLQDMLIKHRSCLERFCEKIVEYVKAANKTPRTGLARNCVPARP